MEGSLFKGRTMEEEDAQEEEGTGWEAGQRTGERGPPPPPCYIKILTTARENANLGENRGGQGRGGYNQYNNNNWDGEKDKNNQNNKFNPQHQNNPNQVRVCKDRTSDGRQECL